ncbi:uncharacterized protein LOC103520770 [Diaphorina citri]|uniref:Uncharacterized protein LOC103520770 n=1 Tax=Diaphorina citri TaxID=121845 RepID=A0A1S3DLK2_DIACI|nr:uncharacterized protein LOC103520770 [Diaphorina citri]
MNRIREIKSLTQDAEWRHVPGSMNPADLPSRGSSVKKYLQLRWWEGPSWLKESPEYWPTSEAKFDEDEINQEKKKTVVSSMLNQSESSEWYNLSSYTKTVRMVAWMLRFKFNSLSKKDNVERRRGELTAEEYQEAEKRLLVLAQRESLNEDKVSSLVRFIDSDGITRIKTKVSNLADTKDFCYPIVLLGEHELTRKLIMTTHTQNCHAGLQTLLAMLRQRYWIVGGRRVVRSVLRTCVTCKRYNAKKLAVHPTPLPEDRVRNAKVFEVSGCDLAGPLYIKTETGTSKVWVCLFTCAVYRAVHLELVTSLSTDSFLQALRRFVSHHGRCRVMYSDQGTNFKGFDTACEKLDWTAVMQFSGARRIQWKFNPPSAPWWGGFFERIVGIVKGLLKRVLGHSLVTYETMLTLLKEVESVINNRPLTYLSEDPQDLSVLTPAMFLHELEDSGVPELDLIENADLRVQFKHRQDLRRQLRERFTAEYLGQLKLKHSRKPEHCIKVGDIVLIGDDNVKRTDWPIARIVALVRGNDNHVRVVKLKTRSGILTRPIQRVYPLEISSNGDYCVSEDVGTDESDMTNNGTSEVDVTLRNAHRIKQTDYRQPSLEQVGQIVKVDSKQPSPIKANITRVGRNVKKPIKLDL